MSSLAAARADNFYIDPARFDPAVKGRDSVNALANSHPLGKRAARLKSDGILIVRFEMMYDCWCTGCEHHVGRGTRFNAEKMKDGAYLSTTIWRFEMKCPACPTIFVIRTDPAAGDYEFVSGARVQARPPPGDAESGMLVGSTRAQSDALSAAGSLYKIEHETDDKRRAQRAHARLAALAEIQAARYEDDGASNAALRATARAGRVADHAAVVAGAALGLAIPLLPASEEDARRAELVMTAALVERGLGGQSGRTATASAPAAGRAAAAAASPAASSLVQDQRHTLYGDAFSVPMFVPATAGGGSALYRNSSVGSGGSGGGTPSSSSAGRLSGRHAVESAPATSAASSVALSRGGAPATVPSSISAAVAAAAAGLKRARSSVDPSLLRLAPDLRGAAAPTAGAAPPVFRRVLVSSLGGTATPSAIGPSSIISAHPRTGGGGSSGGVMSVSGGGSSGVAKRMAALPSAGKSSGSSSTNILLAGTGLMTGTASYARSTAPKVAARLQQSCAAHR